MGILSKLNNWLRMLVSKEEKLIVKPASEQLALIRRGCEQVVPEDELKKKLERSVQTGKPLRVKYGIDPTGIDVHLGHTVPLRKLRLFQELGHQAVLIIGNYTALVGDPSGRDQTRAHLTEEQVTTNALDYLRQIAKIIDIDKSERHYSGDWFKRMSFLDIVRLTSKITMQRMLERDDFTKRVKADKPIYLHECLYPLMQGFDSVEIKSDIELGGSEQLFSLMVGRDLQRDAGQEPQICLTLPILVGLDGTRRMGKSLGNYIGVGEPGQVQFDKTMSIPDVLMPQWFELLPDRPQEEIKRLSDAAATHPMEAKKTLAADIVSFYYGAGAAGAARTEWEKRFSQKQDPSEIAEFKLPTWEFVDGKIWICKLLVLLKLADSNSEAGRNVEAGAVNVGPDREIIKDRKAQVAVTEGLIVRNGKRKIARIRLG
jgi:tyrosyl-tRNA synthetase